MIKKYQNMTFNLHWHITMDLTITKFYLVLSFLISLSYLTYGKCCFSMTNMGSA